MFLIWGNLYLKTLNIENIFINNLKILPIIRNNLNWLFKVTV